MIDHVYERLGTAIFYAYNKYTCIVRYVKTVNGSVHMMYQQHFRLHMREQLKALEEKYTTVLVVRCLQCTSE